MFNNISVLGSTGSIGKQALSVAKHLNINIVALTAMKNIDLIEEQINIFKPKIVAIFDEESAYKLKERINNKVKIISGKEGLIEAATINDAEMVLNSVVGIAGLIPTIEAINKGKHIALANKETLVAGGELVMKSAVNKNVSILPVDSEHSAIFQILRGLNEENKIKRIILTASGGPFYGKLQKDLENITPNEALKHPTWSMGKKISIDSATLMNKGLEVIEAKWLFDVDVENIDVVVHKQSIIHSMVEFIDNSTIAQLSVADMSLPIQYAITYPKRYNALTNSLDLTKIGNLSFEKPDEDTFICLKACKEAIKKGGLLPAIANGANEEAVKLFLGGKIKFLDIGNLVMKAINCIPNKEKHSIDDILKADNNARQFILKETNIRGGSNEYFN